MTFFYDMNKKLKEVLEAPKSVNQQLNERDEGKHNNAVTGFKAVAAKATKEYGSKAAGERVAGAVRNKMKKAGKLEEQGVDEGMFDSLKQGMAKAGKKVARALGGPDDQGQLKDLQRKMGVPQTGKKPAKPMGEEYGPLEEEGQLNELSPELLQRYQDKADATGDKKRMQGSKIADYKLGNRFRYGGDSREAKITARLNAKQAAAKAANPQQTQQPDQSYGRIGADSDRNSIKFGSTYELESAGGTPIDYDKVLEAIAALYGDDIWDNDAMQDLANDLEQAGPTDKELDFIIARGKLPKRLAGIQFSAGDDVQFGESGGTPMTPNQKSFAKLAPPADKITFADKIAGAKKEVDEMLGDVAANAMRKAVKGKKVADEGSDWSQLGKEYSRPKIGSVERGAKHDIEHTATGRKVTRRTDDQGMSVGADDETGASPEKRGRGRPKGSGKSIGAKGPSGKSKLMKREGEKELDEKAVSKKQQKFMGMVHAAQKGEKAASPEVAKVAKTMKKKDAEDFASTKHKGLPEKKKKKEKTEEQGGTGTPTASSGFSFGKGIYDSLNREIENIIAESMSINASDSTEGGKSLTITATDQDALKLAEIVRNAGLGGEGADHEHPGAIEVHGSMDADGAEELAHDLRGEAGMHSPISGDEGACETCGSHDCGCGDIEEALAENEPDWPTDEVESDDALQYSGGLNGPKSTGQTTVPVIAHQGDRTGVDDELRRIREMAGVSMFEQEQVMAPEAVEEAKEEELDEAKEMCDVCETTPCKCEESVEESIAKLRGLAGIQEAAKPDFTDVDDDGDKKESWKKAEQDKKDAEDKKVDESIFRMTNLWKAYKG